MVQWCVSSPLKHSSLCQTQHDCGPDVWYSQIVCATKHPAPRENMSTCASEALMKCYFLASLKASELRSNNSLKSFNRGLLKVLVTDWLSVVQFIWSGPRGKIIQLLQFSSGLIPVQNNVLQTNPHGNSLIGQIWQHCIIRTHMWNQILVTVSRSCRT